MLRVWPRSAWLLRLLLLLLLLVALPPLLPRQHLPLTARSSSLHNISFPWNNFPLWLRKSSTEYPTAALAAALYIFIPRSSTSAASLAHLNKSLPLRNVEFLDCSRHKNFSVHSLQSQSRFLSVCSHAGAQHTASTQTPRAQLDTLAAYFAPSCCSCFPALLKSSCMFGLLRTVVRKRSSRCRSNVLPQWQQRPHDVSRVSRGIACTCAAVSSAASTLFSPPIATLPGPDTTQQLPAGFHSYVVSSCQVLFMCKRCHRRGQWTPQICCCCIRLDPQCTTPAVTSPCRARSRDVFFLRVANAAHLCKTWGREGTSRCCCHCSRSFPASFLRTRDLGACFAASAGTAHSFTAASTALKWAQATRVPGSPSAATSAGGGTRMKKVSKGSATGRRGHVLAEGAGTSLFALSGEERLVTLFFKDSRTAKPLAVLEAASIQRATPRAAAVGAVELALEMTTPLALSSAGAPQAVVWGASRPTQSKHTRFFSSLPSLRVSSETASYPFRSIEEKWVRYYAEHSEDYSPPLPDERGYTRETSFCCPSVEDPASYTCAKAASHLTTTGHVSRTSEAEDPCNRLRARSDIKPSQMALAETAENVDLHVASHKLLSHSSSLPLQSKDEAAANTPRGARLHKERLPDNVLVLEASTKTIDTAEGGLKMTNLAPALDSQTSIDASRAAAFHSRERYRPVNPNQRLHQDEEGFSQAVRAGCGASYELCDDLAGDVRTAEEIHRAPKQARRGDMQTRDGGLVDGKDKQRNEARTAASAISTGKEKKSNKFYILSMIPYPSGDGLHVGHSLTYTVADVVARYKRLQLRAELLRDQERAEERNAFGGNSVEEESRDGVQQQGRQQQLNRTDQRMERHSQKRSSTIKLSSMPATKASGEAHNERNVSLCSEQPIKGENQEQAMFTQASEEGEESVRPLPTQGVVACVTDNGSGQEKFGASRGFGRTAPTASGQSCRGSVTLNHVGKEKHQAPLQQPNVMHVMGWDAFGLPAEQHALVTGIHPRLSVCKNVERFRRQLQRLGLCVDWRREINTSEPEYFRWTQWIFLQMWKRGLVYEKAASVNWCEALGTVLADEEVVNGVSNRGHHPVEQRCLEQWHLRITTYADELLKSLDSLDWPQDVKAMQRNWIGKRDVLYMVLPLLSSSVAGGDTLFAREGEDIKHQAAAEHAGGPGAISYEFPQSDILSACGAAKGRNLSSRSDQTNWHGSFLPSQSGQVDADAAVKLRAADCTGRAGQEDTKPCTLRCVCVSPEFLFGVTFVAMHATHKQAHAAALSLAAREWLARQNCQPAVEQERHLISALHVEMDDLRTKEQTNRSASEERSADLAAADILRELKKEAIAEGKDEENVAVDIHGLRKVSKLNSSFVKEESVFSGSYLKHPLTEAALPVWLFSGKLFDQLRGAGTYFNKHDAVLVVPGQDSVAEWFARAAGLPVIHVLASRPDKAGASHRKTPTTGRGEKVRPHYKEDIVPEETTDACMQDVIINSHSEKISVNGLSRGQARQRLLEHLVARGVGEQQSRFALRDWVFSRQRFWGEPIPLIRAHGLEHGRSSVFAESETNLPVMLPEEMIGRRGGLQKRYRSHVHSIARKVELCSFGEHVCNEDVWPAKVERNLGERRTSVKDNSNRYLQRSSLMAPLAHYPEWWDITHSYDVDTPRALWSMQHTSEDVGGRMAEREAEKMAEKRPKVELQREVSTMPQWAGSSWYFLRFLDPHNTREAFKKEAAQYWMPVDLYVGGKEHAVTHLLYARFWHKVLRDAGCVGCEEPFKRLCTPGIILGTPQYVAFQRLDTGEWVSASSVSLKRNDNLSVSEVPEKQQDSNSSKKQEVTPKMTSARTLETALPVNTQQGSHEVAFCRDKSSVETSTHIAATVTGTGDTSTVRNMARTLLQNVVVGVHNPSGQPVREVTVENAAILHVKESDVPVLKANKNIEAVCRYEKMSKSRGNVISPDSVINAYGADTLRLHLLFMGPIEARKVWSLGGIKGISRFLSRVWHLITSGRKTDIRQTDDGVLSPTEGSTPSLPDASVGVSRGHSLQKETRGEAGKEGFARRTGEHTARLSTKSGESVTADCAEAEQATRSSLWSESCSELQNSRLSAFEKTLLKQLIEHVTRHVERLAFNTALAALMCAVRKLSRWKAEGNTLSVHAALILVRLLHPFAPFITEEMWFRVHERFPHVSRCGSKPSLLACGIWPSNEDTEIDTYDRANDGFNAAKNRRTCADIARGSVPTVGVGVYLDGTFQMKVHVPAGYVNDKTALEEYVKRDSQVSQILEKKEVLRSIVVLKGTLVNFVTKHKFQ